MPDTRYPHQTRDTARSAVSQTEETGRRVVDASAENTRRTAEAGAESVGSAVETGAETTQRAIETGADNVQRVTETGRDVLRQAADTTRDLTQRWSALVSFNTPEAENAVRRANAALQAANQTGNVIAQIAQETFSTWADYAKRVTERRVETLRHLTTLHSPVAALDLQGEHLRAEIELFVEHATRSTERTAALFREAGDKTKQVFDEVAQAADNTELAARKAAARAHG
jgi:hypothetical protein